MGTIRKGAFGGFSGKAGNLVGSSWRDIEYIKSMPKLSNKPKTQRQLEQQAKFALAVRFIQPVKIQVNVGFGSVKRGKASGFNMAIKALLDNAIVGVYPDYEIDYSRVLLAKGSLSALDGFTVTPGPLSLEISWSNDVIPTNGFVSDVLTVLVHDPLTGNFVAGPPDILRSAMSGTVALPSDWLGREVHVYMYFVSQEGGQVSNSVYGGSFTVI